MEDDQMSYPGKGRPELIKTYRFTCGDKFCADRMDCVFGTRREAESEARYFGWGRESSGLWFCPDHIERNAGAKANLGRTRGAAHGG